jgi:4-amino-4-deoxy-L-arabinose transferase-like glycosyltransferase
MRAPVTSTGHPPPARRGLWPTPRGRWTVSSGALLAAVVIGAVLVRLALSFIVARGFLHQLPEQQVSDGYNIIAENLAAGHGYREFLAHPPTLVRPPVYPLLLYGLFKLFGVNYAIVQIVQALLGGLSAWLLYRLGRRVHSVALGLVAAAMFAIYPPAVEYSARLYVENAYYPIFFGLAWALCRAVDDGSPAAGFVAGALWGASLLTRGTLAAFPIFAVLGLAVLRIARRRRPEVVRRQLPRAGAEQPRKWLRWVVMAMIGAVLVVAPWAARNWQLTGRFVPVSTWGWAPFYHGIQCSKHMLSWDDLGPIDKAASERRHEIVVQRLYNGDRTKAYAAPIEYVRHEEIARELVLAELRADPLGALGRGLIGIPFTWFLAWGTTKRLMSFLVHLPIMVLFVAGTLRMARRQADAFARAGPALWLIVFVNLFQAFVYPHVRYMSPATALSFIFGGVMLIGVLQGVLRETEHLDPSV